MVEFCPLCGKLLQHRKSEIDEKLFLAFCTCGYTKETDFSLSLSHKLVTEDLGKGIINADDFDINDGFPDKCKKCGHEMAEITDMGAYYSDESNVYIVKCKKCGFTKRQADGTSNR